MKPGVIALVFVPLIIILGGWQAFERSHPLDVRIVTILSVGGTEPGYNASDFILESVNGSDITLGRITDGKAVILHFWSGDIKELTALQTVRNFYGDKVEILAVTTGAEPVEGITFPILSDPESEVGKAYGVSALPATYFIGNDMKIFDKKEGAMTEQELNEKVKALIAVK
ncbi:MAG: redoxin domain-containing protein [Candidatus Aenigmarchaeota archaeon]|nr:redoxin domain-containing protein [Candidatus Aenigmarchaeota archaeon]